ncbi:MAG: nucleotide exchange factor GrpE [Bdellovibrionales bacterium]|nr:nucleotide exchange factor GrpE [Bdellovibrionales bacterium]
MIKKKDASPQIEIDPSVLEEAASVVKTKDVDPDEFAQKDSESETGEAKKTVPDVDYKDRFIRLSADFDNFRKRIQKEKIEYIKYGNEALLKELLPILDNFERALSASETSDASSILQGVKMILTQMMGTLEKFGLTSMSSMDQPFDPNLHDAMANVEDDNAKPNTIVEEHQKMYRYHDKLLRPALVTVAVPSKDTQKS